MLSQCNYAEAVWNIVAIRFGLHNFTGISTASSPVDWLRRVKRGGTIRQRKDNAGVLLTFWWTLSKERNRQVFEFAELSAPALAALAIDAITRFRLASQVS
jgi:hypothetical protein